MEMKINTAVVEAGKVEATGAQHAQQQRFCSWYNPKHPLAKEMQERSVGINELEETALKYAPVPGRGISSLKFPITPYTRFEVFVALVHRPGVVNERLVLKCRDKHPLFVSYRNQENNENYMLDRELASLYIQQRVPVESKSRLVATLAEFSTPTHLCSLSDYVPGGSPYQLGKSAKKNGGFSFTEKCYLATEMLLALEEFHEVGLKLEKVFVHLDAKNGNNWLLDKYGRLKLIDYQSLVYPVTAPIGTTAASIFEKYGFGEKCWEAGYLGMEVVQKIFSLNEMDEHIPWWKPLASYNVDWRQMLKLYKRLTPISLDDVIQREDVHGENDNMRQRIKCIDQLKGLGRPIEGVSNVLIPSGETRWAAPLEKLKKFSGMHKAWFDMIASAKTPHVHELMLPGLQPSSAGAAVGPNAEAAMAKAPSEGSPESMESGKEEEEEEEKYTGHEYFRTCYEAMKEAKLLEAHTAIKSVDDWVGAMRRQELDPPFRPVKERVGSPGIFDHIDEVAGATGSKGEKKEEEFTHYARQFRRPVTYFKKVALNLENECEEEEGAN